MAPPARPSSATTRALGRQMADHATSAGLTVALTLGSEQVEAIARRVAELLRPEAATASEPEPRPSPLMTPAEAAMRANKNPA